jgi:predicted alpha/beta hydrolase
VTATPVTIRCADGYALKASVFEPDAPTGMTVIVAGAMLVRESFYARYAAWLAMQGVRSITFANRGSGISLAAESRSWDHRIEHWGQRDLAAVIDHVHAQAPQDCIYLLGHSMGGQLVGLTDRIAQLAGIVTVAATAAWWGHWKLPDRWGILAWYCAVPAIGRALSTFPADLFGLGPDTHSELVRGWAKWGRHPDYLYGPFDLTHHAGDYSGRILAFSFADDRHLGARKAVQALHAHFTQADLTFDHVDPRRFGVPAIGHFGFFRTGAGSGLWEPTLAWMRNGR